MADDFQKNIVVSVSTDTGQASKELGDLKTKVDGIGTADLTTPFKSLRLELRQATADAQIAFQQFGQFSPQFIEATKRAAEFKEEIRKYQATVTAFDPANKLEAVVGVARGAVGAIQGVAGAMAFFGDTSKDSLETIRKLQGLMAFSEALGSITLLRNSWTAFGTVIKSSSAFMAINNGLTKAATVIQGLFGVAVDESAVSFKVLKGAIAATGIGLLIVAIGELVAHWDDLTGSVKDTTQAQKDYTKASADSTKDLENEIDKVDLVNEGFALFHKGLISRKEALDTYNTSLGDAFGKTNDLGVAEKNLRDKTPDYLEGMRLRMVAMNLMAASAALAAERLTKVFDPGVMAGFDKIGGDISDALGAPGLMGNSQTMESRIAQHNADIDNQVKALKVQSDQLFADSEKAFAKGGITVPFPGGSKDKDTTDTPAKSNFEELERSFQSHLDAIKRMKDDANAKDIDGLSKRNQELVKADADYNKRKDELDKQATLDAKALEGKDLSPEEVKKANAILLKIQVEHDEASAALLQQYREHYKGINDKFNQSDYDDAVAAAHKALLTQDTLAIGAAKGDLRKVTSKDRPDPKDNAAEAKRKLQEIFESNQKELELERKKELDADTSAADEKGAALQAINDKWDDTEAAAAQDLADKKKKIDEDTFSKKMEFLDAIGSAVSNAGNLADDIAGKQTVTGKVLAIAAATIDTYAAIAKTLKAYAGVPIPGFAIAQAIATGIFGLAQVVKIINTKVPKDTGGGSSAPVVSAPQLTATLLPQSAADQIQNVRVVNNNQTPIKAYITQTDLANSQQKQDLFNRLSSI